MCLIAVVADKVCDLDVWYASIACYLIDAKYSFVTVELAISPSVDCKEVVLVLDGEPPSTAKRKAIQSGRNFRELIRISQSTVRPSNGVWDFRETIFDSELVTNKGYEGPEEWRVITSIDHDSVLFYGRETAVPRFAGADLRSNRGLSLLTLSGAEIRAGSLALLRVGFFLSRHFVRSGRGWRASLNSWWRTQWRHRPRRTFRTPYYTYSLGDYEALRNLGVARKLDQSRLWLRLEPFTRLDSNRYDSWRDATSSDLWVVGYGSSGVEIRSPRERLDEELTTRPTGYALYTQRDEDPDSPYGQAHLRLGKHFPHLEATASVLPRNDVLADIQWYGEIAGTTIRSYLHHLLVYMALLSLAVGLSIAYFGDVRGLVPILLVAYVVLVVAGVWAWQKLPVVSRPD